MTPAERRALRAFLAEDFGRKGDVTSQSVLGARQTATAELIANEAGVIAGLPYVAELFRLVDRRVRVRPRIREGAIVHRGQRVAVVAGPARAVLATERTALNLLGHLSGIATLTQKFVRQISGTRAAIYDTRKTRPGLRAFEKYAVRVGGGHNHRASLAEQLLIKTNHLRALRGSRIAAVRQALVRARARGRGPIAIEASSMPEVLWALVWNADLILLDNLSVPGLRHAVRLRNALRPATPLEASGGVTLQNIRSIAMTRVNRISVGTITKRAHMLDFALRLPDASPTGDAARGPASARRGRRSPDRGRAAGRRRGRTRRASI